MVLRRVTEQHEAKESETGETNDGTVARLDLSSIPSYGDGRTQTKIKREKRGRVKKRERRRVRSRGDSDDGEGRVSLSGDWCKVRWTRVGLGIEIFRTPPNLARSASASSSRLVRIASIHPFSPSLSPDRCLRATITVTPISNPTPLFPSHPTVPNNDRDCLRYYSEPNRKNPRTRRGKL